MAYTEFTKTIVAALVAPSTLAAAQSPSSADAPPPRPPAVAKMAPPKAAVDMQQVLDALAELGAKPVQKLTSAQARTSCA